MHSVCGPLWAGRHLATVCRRHAGTKAVVALSGNELPPHAAPVAVPPAVLRPFLAVVQRRPRRPAAARRRAAAALSKPPAAGAQPLVASTSSSSPERVADAPLALGGLHRAPAEGDAWMVAEAATVAQLPTVYWQLAKGRLTILVGVTCVAGYCMAPPVCLFAPAAFAAAALGTGLMSAAANTYNQILEVPYDAQMRRTQSRPLVLCRVSAPHAAAFGTACALGGGALLLAVSPTAAALGAANVLLYAGVYTPMKRHSIACTWAGALVGAIPPLMGWAAAGAGVCSPAALTLAAVLFSWQFPHFNALSWNLRGDYSKAGYRVMCVTDTLLCRRTTIRHSVALLGLCSVAAPLSELTTWQFGLDSLPLNIYLIYLAAKFHRAPDAKTSRSLFRYTLAYLPLLLMLMVVDRRARRATKRADNSGAPAAQVDDIC